jgi:monovalent cation:H+ antiporter, CPA1 family
MYSVTTFFLLFMIATAVAIVIRRFHIPYTVALVLAGLLLGFLHAIEAPHLTKALLFTVFLPGLIFEAAFHIDFQQFWRNRLIIISLAVPGVIAAIALTTFFLTPVAEILTHRSAFTWQSALVFGALISATDPIAVVATFKKLGVPKRLSIILEGESLLNDGTGIVFFTLSLAFLAGNGVTVGGVGLKFISIVGMGLLIGTVTGLIVSQISKRIDDAMIEIALTTIAAYGAFIAAEQIHSSGVIAAVTAGLFCGNYGARIGMSPSSRIAIESFWEYVAFALNSIVFLLIGFEVSIDALLSAWQMILVAYLIVTLGRIIVIFGASALIKFTREKIPWSWSVVLSWGGLRGALPMVLVLSIPRDVPSRDLLVTMTFGVVLLSLLIHGLSISPLLRWLGIVRGSGESKALAFARGKLLAAYAALGTLDQMSRDRLQKSSIVPTLRQEYDEMIRSYEQKMAEIQPEQEQLDAEETKWVRRHLLLVEKRRVIESFHEGRMDQEIYEKLLGDIDARLLKVETEL